MPGCPPPFLSPGHILCHPHSAFGERPSTAGATLCLRDFSTLLCLTYSPLHFLCQPPSPPPRPLFNPRPAETSRPRPAATGRRARQASGRRGPGALPFWQRRGRRRPQSPRGCARNCPSSLDLSRSPPEPPPEVGPCPLCPLPTWGVHQPLPRTKAGGRSRIFAVSYRKGRVSINPNVPLIRRFYFTKEVKPSCPSSQPVEQGGLQAGSLPGGPWRALALSGAAVPLWAPSGFSQGAPARSHPERGSPE